MLDLVYQLFFRFPVIGVAEAITIVILSRKRVRHRLRWVVGSYLLFVAAALAFGLIVRDDFGYGFIPLLIMTAPWQLLHIRLPDSAFTSDMAQMVFGLVLHCVAFYVLDRLSYPEHMAPLPDRQATQT